MQTVDHSATLSSGFRTIEFKAGHAIQALLASAVVYGFFMAWAILLPRMGAGDPMGLAFAHVGAGAALLTFWRLGRWGRARFDSFGSALLLVSAAFRLHALVDALIYGTRVDEMYRYRTLPVPDPVIDLLLKGEFITTVGLLLVVCSWRLGIGGKIERFSFLRQNQQVPLKLAMGIYLAALLVDVASRVLRIGFGPLEQLTSLLFGFGVAAIYFIAARGQSGVRQVVLAGVLGLPMTFLALNSGMKSEMLFPMIPAALLYWTRFNNLPARGLALALGIALLALSQMYVHYVRDTTWKSTGVVQTSAGELVAGFGDQVGAMKSTDALDSIGSRVNLTIAHATSVILADSRGHEPVEVFGMIPASVIPRVFWPGKPIMQPGAMQTARILGGNILVSEIRSATAAGFATELYLGGWWFGVVLGCALYGFMLAWAQKWSFRHSPGFGHQALCFLTLYWTIRFDENHVVYAFTSIIFTVVFLWMLNRTTNTLGFTTVPSTTATRAGNSPRWSR